jgi:hypothetical protein
MARKPRPKEDRRREKRIRDEIIVDTFSPEERAMGWYYYPETKLSFPFTADCIAKRAVSPRRTGDKLEVVGMAPEEECRYEMYVETP